MNIDELKAAIKFGEEVIEEYKNNGKTVPNFVYEKVMLLQDELIGVLSKNVANKVFEIKGVQN